MISTTQQRCYNATIQVTLDHTDRDVIDEFGGTQSVRRIDRDTVEVVRDVVAPSKRAAYRRACNLISAICDAAGLHNQYRLTDVRVQEVC